MELPRSFDEHDVRARKVEVLQAVRRLSPEDVSRGTGRGRYGAGRLGARVIPASVDEPGVDSQRGAPTLFICDDEAEESWQIIAPIGTVWAEQKVPRLEYPAGSARPEVADIWQ